MSRVRSYAHSEPTVPLHLLGEHQRHVPNSASGLTR
jgi:hypothetical protein